MPTQPRASGASRATITNPLQRISDKFGYDETIAYFTSDRQPDNLFGAAIAQDVLPIFHKHLKRIGKKNKIGLFLFSAGGSIETPWPLVSLIREYCKNFEVVLPNKALSAATLICLGADKIVMTPYSYMSPIDPRGHFKLGNQNKQIQVEDVSSFIRFAKEKIGNTEQESLAEVMKILSAEIPPSILGSIYRTHFLIRALAEKLLKTHAVKLEDHQIAALVENLTEKLFAHNHLINRREAKNGVGFKNLIRLADDEETDLIDECFETFKQELELDSQFDPQSLLGTNQEINYNATRAIIQSSAGKHAFQGTYKISKVSVPNQPPFNIDAINNMWVETP